MAEFPALPLWTDAYLADTRHLSTIEHGAYLLLLFEAWRRPHCNLPDDDEILARLAGLETDEWVAVKPSVMAFWKRDGRSATWRQKRLTAERMYVADRSRVQRDNVRKRWNKKKNNDTTVIPNGYQTDTPTPTPTPIVPLDKSNGHEVDQGKVFWDAAKAYLGASKSSVIGKLAQEFGREAVGSAITVAMLQTSQPPDRVAYVIGILKRQATGASNGYPPGHSGIPL